MHETKAELERFIRIIASLKVENASLAEENEILSKDTPTRSIYDQQYDTPSKPDLTEGQTDGRMALIRGSPVGENMFDAYPNGYEAPGMYRPNGNPKKASA